MTAIAAPTMRTVDALRLHADATLGGDTELHLRHAGSAWSLGRLPAGQLAVVDALAQGWVDDDTVDRLVVGLDGEAGLLPARLLLRRLMTQSWLRRRIVGCGRTLLQVEPGTPGPGARPARRVHQPGAAYRLSRFVELGPGPHGLAAPTPRASVVVHTADPLVAGALARTAIHGLDLRALAAAIDLPPAVAGPLLDELISDGVLVPAAGDDDEAGGGAYWSADELRVHDRSRAGRHARPIGGTYRFRDRVEPEPLARPAGAGERLCLDVPAGSASLDLYDVMARRRSVREHDDAAPITVTELGHFLHRVQRTTDVASHGGQEVGRRPYPTAGRICELELYCLVTRCAGLAPGLYRYDSQAHELELLAAPGPHSARVLAYGRAAGLLAADPQVHLVVTARMARVGWKYEGLGYTLALRDAGVLTAWMYLVATAMDLAPCALGSGNSAAFSAASGVDPVREPSISDFVLGSRKKAS